MSLCGDAGLKQLMTGFGMFANTEMEPGYGVSLNMQIEKARSNT